MKAAFAALILALVLFAPHAAAQSPPTAAELDAAEEILVLSVIRDGARYVYDVYDHFEDEVVLFRAGALVARSESRQRVMVVLEPDSTYPAARGSNALFLSPQAPIGQFVPPPEYELGLVGEATQHAVHVFVCTDDSDDALADIATGPCGTWTKVEPKSGGDGLELIIVPGPEQGGNRGRADDDG